MGEPDKIVERSGRAFGHDLDRTVMQVLYDATYPGCTGTFRNKVPVSYTLNAPLRNGADPFHMIQKGSGFMINLRNCSGMIL
jgi:hypothetical protein